MIDAEADFILKTIEIISKNLDKLEESLSKFQEESDTKFITQFQEVDAMRFDIEAIKQKLRSKPYLTDGGQI